MKTFIRSLILLLLAAGTITAYAGPILQAFEPDSLPRLIEKQRDMPFVLIIWSLDCEYCHASMKTMSQEIRKGRKLRVVTLSTDPAADPQLAALMRQRLAALGLPERAWAFGAAPAEQLRFAIDPKWHGEKPRTYWFNGRGERVAYSGIITADTIARLTSAW